MIKNKRDCDIKASSLFYVFYCRQEDFSTVCEINGAVRHIDKGVTGLLNESDCIFVKLLLH